MTDNERERLMQKIADALSAPVSIEMDDGRAWGPLLPQHEEKHNRRVLGLLVWLPLILTVVGLPLIAAIKDIIAMLSQF